MYETIIKGAMICDGLGGPMYQGSLGVTDDRIAAIGSDIGPGRKTVDAENISQKNPCGAFLLCVNPSIEILNSPGGHTQ